MALDLELPAVYLDAVLLDAAPARPALVNRDPEPGETGVPIATTIALEVTDVGPDGVDLAATQVFVAGVLAFAGGAFQPGFDGPASAASNPQAETLRITVDPAAAFDSLQQVAIRVVSRTAGGAFALDATYAFTCEDLTAPRVVGAQARALRRVRVSFDEPVKQADPAASDDALNPAAYAFARRSAPAVDATAVAVESVTAAAVDVLTDVPLTPGAAYEVAVRGPVDRAGNAVAAPYHAAAFAGFVPPRPAARRFDLYGLLPEMNRREDATGDLRRLLACLQEVTDLLLDDVDRFTDVLDPDVAPEPFLDAMLADLGNPFPFELAAVDKRRLLQVLVAIYREKGTAVGIANAIRFFLGLEVAVGGYAGEALVLGESALGEDWVLAAGAAVAAYAFEVAAPRALAGEERRRVRQIVDYMRPAHAHFVRLVEPTLPVVPDHLELGLSELGESWLLH